MVKSFKSFGHCLQIKKILDPGPGQSSDKDRFWIQISWKTSAGDVTMFSNCTKVFSEALCPYAGSFVKLQFYLSVVMYVCMSIIFSFSASRKNNKQNFYSTDFWPFKITKLHIIKNFTFLNNELLTTFFPWFYDYTQHAILFFTWF